jgi:ankyrin repeat protein
MSRSINRLDHSPPPSPRAAPPVLVLSNSGKRMDRKKYVKQVTGRHNDTELHLAAQRGDLDAVRQIIAEIDAQMTGTGEDFDTEVAEIRAAVVNEANEVEETALLIAAEKGFIHIVLELLKHSDKDSLARKNKSGFDALHVAAKEGHRGEHTSSDTSQTLHKTTTSDSSGAHIYYYMVVSLGVVD